MLLEYVYLYMNMMGLITPTIYIYPVLTAYSPPIYHTYSIHIDYMFNA